ncbi:isopentenyl-diphosphate delta-isomerase [Pedobacter sp. PACM 27299]|uniref:isopentenyl-diphosphate Delta-isomerase n=1 Tax=Pedobacter sp. PACM 27299 TaxID=1727164 RepID=UPI00070579B7|nr:isopentenyl-diphosphate Delta-isomerase [Pedobacter sp. PACM 27299]ALL05095.1 isopentenyl-diphosphate delta-isomerase [Pedobacter sp. PACM 27299]
MNLMREEEVILVDENDNPIGTMPKLKAHLEGELHRAFSVFIFNSSGALLLQQRALDKYHSAGKWTNTCCSHPRPGELTADAAKRRLKEEMGMECELRPVFSFAYRAEVENELVENEYDHVYFGSSDTLPMPNPVEVADFKYINMEELELDLKNHKDVYTEWLKICFDQVMHQYRKMSI